MSLTKHKSVIFCHLVLISHSEILFKMKSTLLSSSISSCSAQSLLAHDEQKGNFVLEEATKARRLVLPQLLGHALPYIHSQP